ncbi:MAG: PP2C family serine/threonine-protein phosphatase [Anaerolineae bacterium]|jgi:serine/threonine protein phosphatase PrpC|nr:SpoIIE family protein phosphatase [Chloroflexota bacterium]
MISHGTTHTCHDCGRDNRPGASFCAWCGSPIPSDEDPWLTPRASPVPPGAGGAVTRKLDPAELDLAMPLGVGTLLAQRYEILELLTETPDNRIYRARDRQRCPSCGQVALDTPAPPYCSRCGAQMAPAGTVSILEYRAGPSTELEGHFQDGGRDYYVQYEPSGPSRALAASDWRVVFGTATDPGCQADTNEDALDARLYADHRGTRLGYFVVADGVGGQQHGEIASHAAVQAAWHSLYEGLWQMAFHGEAITDADARAAVTGAINAANSAVQQARSVRQSDMTTTITLAVLVGRRAHIGNLGDSRTYLWDAQGLHRVTKDHSFVQRLVDTGQIRPEEVYTHPRRNLIYGSLGEQAQCQPDLYTVEVGPDARLVLCSDGLWEMVRDEGIEEVLLAEPDPQRAAERLLQNALLAGGADNIAVVVVQLER